MKFKKEVNGNEIEVIFDYQESCNYVYKTFKVYINDCKSNIKGLLKYLDYKDLPEILTKNTFYWSPGSKAAWRRSNEKKRNGEVYDFLLKNGFELVK